MQNVFEENAPDELARRLAGAVERRCGGRASLSHVEQVHLDLVEGKGWDGAIHVFDLDSSYTVQRVYAWASTPGGGVGATLHVVLNLPSIVSAYDAVRRTLCRGRRPHHD